MHAPWTDTVWKKTKEVSQWRDCRGKAGQGLGGLVGGVPRGGVHTGAALANEKQRDPGIVFRIMIKGIIMAMITTVCTFPAVNYAATSQLRSVSVDMQPSESYLGGKKTAQCVRIKGVQDTLMGRGVSCRNASNFVISCSGRWCPNGWKSVKRTLHVRGPVGLRYAFRLL